MLGADLNVHLSKEKRRFFHFFSKKAKNGHPGHWVVQLRGASDPLKKLISKWKSNDGERGEKGSRAAPGLSQMQIISRSENLI